MNVRQEGMGLCKTCGNPIMQTINQPGIAGICFGCSEDAKPKTGHTVIVKSETGSTKLDRNAPEGKVELEVVDEHTVQIDPTRQTKLPPKPLPTGLLTVSVSIDELYDADILKTLLIRINESIDNMPPPPTIKEAKRVFKLQERIEEVIKGMEK